MPRPMAVPLVFSCGRFAFSRARGSFSCATGRDKHFFKKIKGLGADLLSPITSPVAADYKPVTAARLAIAQKHNGRTEMKSN